MSPTKQLTCDKEMKVWLGIHYTHLKNFGTTFVYIKTVGLGEGPANSADQIFLGDSTLTTSLQAHSVLPDVQISSRMTITLPWKKSAEKNNNTEMYSNNSQKHNRHYSCIATTLI